MEELLDIDVVSGGIILNQDIDEGDCARRVRAATPAEYRRADTGDLICALTDFGLAYEGMYGKGLTFRARTPDGGKRGMHERCYRRLMSVHVALAPFVEAGSSLTFEVGRDASREADLARPWMRRETFLFTGDSVLWITTGGDIKGDAS